MSRVQTKLTALALLMLGCTGLLVADDKKPATPTTPSTTNDKIDWGAFVDYSKVVGEVEKVDQEGNGFTLKIHELIPQVSRGTTSSRTRPQQPKITTKSKTEKFSLTFHDEGLVRWEKIPPKFDDKGKKTFRTEKEIRDMKKPLGAPGYVADKADLAAGQIVEVTLMRPKNVSVEKVVSADLRVKYVMIAGTQGTQQPTDPAAKDGKKDAKKDGKKKDDPK